MKVSPSLKILRHNPYNNTNGKVVHSIPIKKDKKFVIVNPYKKICEEKYNDSIGDTSDLTSLGWKNKEEPSVKKNSGIVFPDTYSVPYSGSSEVSDMNDVPFLTLKISNFNCSLNFISCI